MTEEHRPVWMVERQAFGGQYWERITFGPFAARAEAEEFTRCAFGGHVYDAARQGASHA